jgi:hypothetical protein
LFRKNEIIVILGSTTEILPKKTRSIPGGSRLFSLFFFVCSYFIGQAKMLELKYAKCRQSCQEGAG